MAIPDLNPYCAITLGQIKKKTSPLSRQTDGVWNETFILFVFFFLFSPLSIFNVPFFTFACKSQDKDLKKVKSPGELLISINHSKKGAVKLVSTGDCIGRVQLFLEWFDFSTSAPVNKFNILSRSDKKIGSILITVQVLLPFPRPPISLPLLSFPLFRSFFSFLTPCSSFFASTFMPRSLLLLSTSFPCPFASLPIFLLFPSRFLLSSSHLLSFRFPLPMIL